METDSCTDRLTAAQGTKNLTGRKIAVHGGWQHDRGLTAVHGRRAAVHRGWQLYIDAESCIRRLTAVHRGDWRNFTEVDKVGHGGWWPYTELTGVHGGWQLQTEAGRYKLWSLDHPASLARSAVTPNISEWIQAARTGNMGKFTNTQNRHHGRQQWIRCFFSYFRTKSLKRKCVISNLNYSMNMFLLSE